MIKKILISIIIICAIGFGINRLLQNSNNADSKYNNCELGDLVGDDVERTVYKKYNIDYHSEDFSKSQAEDFAQECLNDGVKNQYQMDCCLRMKMFGEI